VKVMHEHRDKELSRALHELPVPPMSQDFFGRLNARLDRPRPRRFMGVAALAAAALVAGGFAGAELAGSSRAASTPVAAFAPAVGWNTVETNNRVTCATCPDKLDLAWAANVPFAPQDTQTDWPTTTLKSLSAGAIVIVVVGPFPSSASLPELKLPVRVEDMNFNQANWWEGQPAADVSGYWIGAHTTSDQNFDIYVWMGSDNPSSAMKAAADEELARLTLPS
jgi:hypothetical protein